MVVVKDVDLENGPWSGSAGAFDAVGDVTGKVVVIDFESTMWSMSMPDMEAGLRGAAAVILTYNPDWPGFYGQPDALAAFDAETDLSAPPMVWIPWRDGDGLKEALQVGAVTATVKLNAPLTLIADGGTGYNVVGKIKGSTNKSEYVVFGGHHDAWFQGGLDNASSVVDGLVVAKAMKMSHYKPKRTMVFLNTTAEEYGSATARTIGASARGASSRRSTRHGRAGSPACSTPRSSATRRATSGCSPAPRSPRCSRTSSPPAPTSR